MFKFNFNNENEKSETELVSKDQILWYDSKEIMIPANIKDVVRNIPREQILKVEYDCGFTFSYLSVREVMNNLKEQSDSKLFLDVLKADSEQSDLLPGKYEGGLKTWECSKDLITYFMKNVVRETNKLEKKMVLDLGCGSGILGIMCLLFGANVTFQDYNQEVLESMTIPNIFLNLEDVDKERLRFFMGDWSSFLDVVVHENSNSNEKKRFDYILTSETIYNPANYYKLIKIFEKLLKPNGIAFVAAKSHYFGVGGNLKEFEIELIKNGLLSEICWEKTEGLSRGILKVQLGNKLENNETKS